MLINRAHPFTDLILTVDAFEELLFAAIDGQRTLAEIILIAGKSSDESRAVEFFEKLWRYDQVVFGASHPA